MNILITRFSSLGDVAMSLPVIRAFQLQFPEHNLYVLSNKFFKDLFALEKKVTFIEADLKNEHHGIRGLHQLYRTIKRDYQINLVIDLHSSLRSNFLNTLFKTAGVSVFRLDKGRSEKKALLTQKVQKKLVPLQHNTERYADVFRQAGFDIKLENELTTFQYPISDNVASRIPIKNTKWIGVAPFAKHKGKQLPLRKNGSITSAIGSNSKRFPFFCLGMVKRKN